jgi:hypothetical protein
MDRGLFFCESATGSERTDRSNIHGLDRRPFFESAAAVGVEARGTAKYPSSLSLMESSSSSSSAQLLSSKSKKEANWSTVSGMYDGFMAIEWYDRVEQESNAKDCGPLVGPFDVEPVKRTRNDPSVYYVIALKTVPRKGRCLRKHSQTHKPPIFLDSQRIIFPYQDNCFPTNAG